MWGSIRNSAIHWRIFTMTDLQLQKAMEFSHPITPVWIQDNEEREIVQ